MANDQYNRALDRLIERFKSDFVQHSREQFTGSQGKVTHPGEFGHTRELMCKNLCKNIIPRMVDIETRGFIISPSNFTSKEQDLILYSREDTPVLTLDSAKFFPMETVIAVVQVKSILRSKSELKSALEELSHVKAVRKTVGNTAILRRVNAHRFHEAVYNPKSVHDQISSFLICEKIDFNITPQEVNDLYSEEIELRMRHNMILDISRGAYGYNFQKANFQCIGIPAFPNEEGAPAFISDVNNWHIKQFLTSLQILATGATIFHPDMGVYLRAK